ncbi:hypothetical protein RBSWK_04593 [Rhodopirellula baltica SWK14]|uniref:Uncharacterized protein n=1 Tax=Rhodopirellula baltica SWK14 TaxID=993516 RepID=L7CC97_RHOBT|nr:hypothetical protein RBSWK_04593 [Rhodopirellula baltica SWK14]
MPADTHKRSRVNASDNVNRQSHDSDAKVFQPGASIIEADCC